MKEKNLKTNVANDVPVSTLTEESGDEGVNCAPVLFFT